MINIIRKEPVIKKSIFIMMMSIIVIFSIFTVFQYNNLKNIYLEQENINKRVVGILVNKYPQQEVDIVKSIYKQDNRYLDLGAKTLDKYGYDNNYNMYENVNFKEHLKYFLVNNLTVFVIIIILVSFIVFNFTKYMYNRLLKVNSDIENIINNKYIAQEEFKEEGVFNRIYTDLNKLSRSLNLKISSLDKEKESIKELVTDISHQLKTPITSIRIQTELLLEENQNKKLYAIEHQIQRIQLLVNDLQTIALLDSHNIQYCFKEYDLQMLIDEIEEDLDYLNPQIHLNKNIKVLCDEKWFIEALENIIKNCLEKNSTLLSIFAYENETTLKMMIQDQGNGFKEKDLPFLFQRFYRGENSKGTGLGLYIAKEIIEAHHGFIKAYNQQGACFEIVLPQMKMKKKI